jgi:hypothetical protein
VVTRAKLNWQEAIKTVSKTCAASFAAALIVSNVWVVAMFITKGIVRRPGHAWSNTTSAAPPLSASFRAPAWRLDVTKKQLTPPFESLSPHPLTHPPPATIQQALQPAHAAAVADTAYTRPKVDTAYAQELASIVESRGRFFNQLSSSPALEVGSPARACTACG